MPSPGGWAQEQLLPGVPWCRIRGPHVWSPHPRVVTWEIVAAQGWGGGGNGHALLTEWP